jgi:uncharacterized protein YbaR (Trm112 family)
MMLKKELLAIIACPKCKGPVQEDERQQALVCIRCRLAYPVRDGIPIMLVDEAHPLAPSDEKQ